MENEAPITPPPQETAAEAPGNLLPAPAQPENTEPTYTHTRTGKVARLPENVRNQINQMLLDGVPFLQVIQNIGEHGKDLNEDNISNWKAGGFEDWLAERQRNEALCASRQSALGLLRHQAGPTVQDASRTVAAAQLYEFLLSFEPTSFAAALADKPELYLRLINALARLSEGEAVCAHRRAQQSLTAAKLGAPKTDGKQVVSKENLLEIARLIKLL